MSAPYPQIQQECWSRCPSSPPRPRCSVTFAILYCGDAYRRAGFFPIDIHQPRQRKGHLVSGRKPDKNTCHLNLQIKLCGIITTVIIIMLFSVGRCYFTILVIPPKAFIFKERLSKRFASSHYDVLKNKPAPASVISSTAPRNTGSGTNNAPVV